MNIQQAMEQVRGAVRAYLSRDERGLLRIPVAMQRPLLMLGPPGVGKTAVASQVAAELGVNFVSYSITHHTRQTALGLPVIVEREYGGRAHQVSEYTMSEIIGAVYDAVERTGVSEGILFLDEVNCVSETLAPAMLQFLQYKTFGQHRLPAGWVIVCAGNPPEYNRAAREFDPAVMDRLKCIAVEPDVNVWLEYAVAQGVHPAILGYLEAKPEAFYLVRAGVQGMRLVTARGWEDLSRMLLAYEAEGLPADEALVCQYLQDAETARDFTVHYRLFCKYRDDYRVPDILAGAAVAPDAAGDADATATGTAGAPGTAAADLVARAAAAPFDERMALVGLLGDATLLRARHAAEVEQALRLVRADIVAARPALEGKPEEGPGPEDAEGALFTRLRKAEEGADDLADFRAVEGDAEAVRIERIRVLKEVCEVVARAQRQGEAVHEATHEAFSDTAYEAARSTFNAACARQREQASSALQAVENAYAFLDAAFGAQGQEALVFTTRLAADPAFVGFAARQGCAAFVAHGDGLLIRDRTRALLQEVEALEA